MLNVRTAKISDISKIQKLTSNVYPDEPPYTKAMLRGQINNFPEGQFVAELDNKIVGYCSTIIVKEKKAFEKHTWIAISGNGFGVTHDPEGDYLYGIFSQCKSSSQHL